MHRDTLAIDNLAPWARLNNVDFNGVKTSSIPGSRGSGLIATTNKTENDALLVTIPQELVLSLENVWIYAKADRHLHQVLEAVGEYSRTARGAILIFLLLQMTNGATGGKIGVLNPFSEYVKFLPARIPIPTFWNDTERLLLTGTSLEAALEIKLKSLDREFAMLRDKTVSIDWCRQYWWDSDSGGLTFDDWKQVDAMYRSRALDLPGTGHAMVPCIDMANHASGDDTTALYDTDSDGNAILILRDGKEIAPNEEITITYGDDKGACEMLFSYGFIEVTMSSARELFLNLDIPDDDPLKLAKKAVAKSAPGFRLYAQGDSIDWEGSFVWLVCVNEEDGLEFKLLQTQNGERELQASWKGEVIPDLSNVQSLVKSEPLWDVFNLRAITTLQERVEQQLFRLEGSKKYIDELLRDGTIDHTTRDSVTRLRDLEETLMLHAYEDFESQRKTLMKSPAVQKYLESQMDPNKTVPEDDFS